MGSVESNEWEYVVEILHRVLPPGRIDDWWYTPAPHLKGQTPAYAWNASVHDRKRVKELVESYLDPGFS